MRFILIILLALSVSTCLAGDNDKQLEKAVKKEVEKELLDVGDKGKPNNPGAKGQANAAYKKATNPGKGSGKDGSVEGAILNEVFDDDDKENNGGKKNKKSGKK